MNDVRCEKMNLISRRCFLVLAGAASIAQSGPVRGEILTKGSFGGRDAYLKRVQELAAALSALPRTDPGRRAELRAIATTLSAAVQDLLFNEAQARTGKVAAPASLLRAPATNSNASLAGEEAVPLSKVPDDWLLLQGGAVRDEATDLAALLEDEGEPLASPTIERLVAAIARSVSALDRPPSP